MVYVDKDDLLIQDKALKSYDDTLAFYTAMAQTGQRSYAVYKDCDDARSLLQNVSTTDYEGAIRVELWKYDPKILTNTQYAVPPLYGFMNDEDERIQGQIDKLIDNFLIVFALNCIDAFIHKLTKIFSL